MKDYAAIADALRSIPSDDRDTWVRVGMSVKAALGDSGRDLWMDWSRYAPNFKQRDADAVWRSIKSAGGIGPATVFALAKQHGWNGAEPVYTATQLQEMRAKRAQEDRAAADAIIRQHKEAAKRSIEILKASQVGFHDYLTRKGFKNETGFIHEGALIIPMRSHDQNMVNSLQFIQPDGSKKFLYGGKARGSIFTIGSGSDIYLCEGYATGLSIKAALASMYQKARVVVCFSAGNLAYVAGKLSGKRYVVADNDASGTGAKSALATGLPSWMPPDVDTDANDFMLAYGVRNLAVKLRELHR